jgi:hypothetical protein
MNPSKRSQLMKRLNQRRGISKEKSPEEMAPSGNLPFAALRVTEKSGLQ